MVFSLYFANVTNYIYWLLYMKPALHSWDKRHIAMVCHYFTVSIHLVFQYFAYMFMKRIQLSHFLFKKNQSKHFVQSKLYKISFLIPNGTRNFCITLTKASKFLFFPSQKILRNSDKTMDMVMKKIVKYIISDLGLWFCFPYEA